MDQVWAACGAPCEAAFATMQCNGPTMRPRGSRGRGSQPPNLLTVRHGPTLVHGLTTDVAITMVKQLAASGDKYNTAATSNDPEVDGVCPRTGNSTDALGTVAAKLNQEALEIQCCIAMAHPGEPIDTLADAMKVLRTEPAFRGKPKAALEALNCAVTLPKHPRPVISGSLRQQITQLIQGSITNTGASIPSMTKHS